MLKKIIEKAGYLIEEVVALGVSILVSLSPILKPLSKIVAILLLWNALMPPLTNVRPISLDEAAGLYFLCWLLSPSTGKQ
jgi:hypothetical protein